MGAFDRWSEGPDRDTPTEVTAVGKLAAVVRLDALADTRTRGETYADYRQTLESGWDRHRLFDAPRAELARFRTERAGLPDITPEEATRYIERHRAERPWLKAAERASPESRRNTTGGSRESAFGPRASTGEARDDHRAVSPSSTGAPSPYRTSASPSGRA